MIVYGGEAVSLRFRLLLSFTTVVIVSVMLFMLSAYLISVAFTGNFRSIGSFYKIHYSLHPLSEEEESLFLDLKYLAKHNPQQLKNKVLLDEYNVQLKMVQAALVLRENDELYYRAPSLEGIELISVLPKYDMGNNLIRNTMNSGNRFFSYSKFDFYFSSDADDKGSIYVIKERSPLAEMVRKILPVLVSIFIFILLLTGYLLYRFITKKIIHPIEQLSQSAEHIANGDLSNQLVVSSNDEIGRFVGVFEQMRLRLHDSIQLQLKYEDNRKQLLSNISHDLRTPITTIKGYAEGIRDGVTNTEEKLQRYVKAIYTRADDMEHMVDELLYYSKLDLKKEPFTFDEIELKLFLNQMIEAFAIEFETKQIQIRWQVLSGKEIYVLADREKLKRVLFNLLNNSIKYMVNDPKIITIALSKDEDKAMVSVEDNGLGIDRQSLPHIFERFYRADSSRNQTLTTGSGLGLAIAAHIIEGHGGFISAESELGGGTKITFTLNILRDHR